MLSLFFLRCRYSPCTVEAVKRGHKMSLWDSKNCHKPGRRNNILSSQAVFVFTVAYSGWRGEHFLWQSNLGREGHCTASGPGNQETWLDQTLWKSQEQMHAAVSAQPCLSLQWHGLPEVLWVAGGGSVLLFHGAGYWPCPTELSTPPSLCWARPILLSHKSNPSHRGDQQKCVACGFASITRDSCMCCRKMFPRWLQPRLWG